MSAERIFSVEFTALAYGGEALGRLPDGRAVFAPYLLPGETARVSLVEEKRGHARAELVELLRPSLERVKPRCAHFGECGGCHYQHMTYAAQLAAKTTIVREQLERLGGLENPPVRPIIPSAKESNYRNHVEFHLAPDGRLGYHRPRSEEVLSIRECHLPEAALNEIWPQLDFEAVSGLERIGLRLGEGEEVQLILESRDPQPLEFTVEGLPLSAVHLGPGGALTLAGSPALEMQVLGRRLRVSAASFFQANTRMAERLVEHILERIPQYAALTPATTLVDAYCGVGLFSLFLAERVGRLAGIEESASACEDFCANLEAFDNMELYEARVEQALPALGFQPDIVLLDPPRAGLERRALEALLRLRPRLIVYVSCDPATLARDGRRLRERGYRLEEVTPFDLFPQTYHVECVSVWRREAISG